MTQKDRAWIEKSAMGFVNGPKIDAEVMNYFMCRKFVKKMHDYSGVILDWTEKRYADVSMKHRQEAMG